MKTFFLSLFAILAVTVGGMLGNDLLNRTLVLASSGSSVYKMWRLFVACPQNELAILGSSRASQNYVPSVISARAFNYGVDGSTMDETLFMLRQVLRNESAMPIIVNLDPWGFPAHGRRSFAADYTLALSSEEVRRALPRERTRFEERCPGIRFHGALRANLTQWLNGRKAVTKEIDSGATLQLFSRTPEEWKVIYATRKPWTFHFSEAWQAELDRLYALTSRSIVWVVGPVSPGDRKLYSGESDLLAFLDAQRRHKNVYAIDLYTPTEDFSEPAFMDPTHLNKQGAIRFTNMLCEKLRELHLLN